MRSKLCIIFQVSFQTKTGIGSRDITRSASQRRQHYDYASDYTERTNSVPAWSGATDNTSGTGTPTTASDSRSALASSAWDIDSYDEPGPSKILSDTLDGSTLFTQIEDNDVAEEPARSSSPPVIIGF